MPQSQRPLLFVRWWDGFHDLTERLFGPDEWKLIVPKRLHFAGDGELLAEVSVADTTWQQIFDYAYDERAVKALTRLCEKHNLWWDLGDAATLYINISKKGRRRKTAMLHGLGGARRGVGVGTVVLVALGVLALSKR